MKKRNYLHLEGAAIGSLHDPVTWYRINYAGTQKTHGTSKTKEVVPVSPTFLCVKIFDICVTA